MHSESDSDAILLPTSGQRGPADHERRAQIIDVADDLFRNFGYRKSSVADISKAMGISTAYIYRFFKSKQAIGEAICATTLEHIDEQLRAIVSLEMSPTKRLRLFMQTALKLSYELFVVERAVNDVVIAAVEGNWCTVTGHKEQMYSMLQRLITAGRQAGEFEKKTPLDEVTDGLAEIVLLYTSARSMDDRSWAALENGMNAATNLILRSLAP
ncbi:AcrR family transcriptional regulator [Pseudomonas sp. JUb42]|jgi:AcrR family transcriptional regulator|uniref:TetR/AcrR family transcriptional regulator n=1 Tax=Pseudomonas sp. JUb42 TaxID=2940611 RepID=UPI002169ED81|nr:TetR/AcrR family transcriptional regulator [Pseudomonas sp. JUb42]MCS3470895.1 AcrR family transcriptional regulator [Pseudomonas sp. JUb42]